MNLKQKVKDTIKQSKLEKILYDFLNGMPKTKDGYVSVTYRYLQNKVLKGRTRTQRQKLTVALRSLKKSGKVKEIKPETFTFHEDHSYTTHPMLLEIVSFELE